MIEFFQSLHWAAIFQIVMIDILLGGDNAVVIALACRKLEPRQRVQGILWGTVGAIGLRVVLIAFALVLLDIPMLKVVGGLLLLWIGVKLLIPDHDEHGNVRASTSVWSAVRTILVADLVMSLDNVLAIAGAAENSGPGHQLGYVIFGLLISVPIIIWGSALVLKLIDRYPLVVTFGAGLLGWIAGGMIMSDVFVLDHVGQVSAPVKIAAEAVGAILVLLLGKWYAGRKVAAKETVNGSV